MKIAKSTIACEIHDAVKLFVFEYRIDQMTPARKTPKLKNIVNGQAKICDKMMM